MHASYCHSWPVAMHETRRQSARRNSKCRRNWLLKVVGMCSCSAQSKAMVLSQVILNTGNLSLHSLSLCLEAWILIRELFTVPQYCFIGHVASDGSISFCTPIVYTWWHLFTYPTKRWRRSLGSHLMSDWQSPPADLGLPLAGKLEMQRLLGLAV